MFKYSQISLTTQFCASIEKLRIISLSFPIKKGVNYSVNFSSPFRANNLINRIDEKSKIGY